MQFDIDTVDKWLVDTLKNNGAVAALVGARVYFDVAPVEAVMPCIIITMADERDVAFVGNITAQTNFVYNVKAVNTGGSFVSCYSIRKAADAALKAACSITANIGVIRTGGARFTEQVANVKYNYLVSIWRVLAG